MKEKSGLGFLFALFTLTILLPVVFLLKKRSHLGADPFRSVSEIKNKYQFEETADEESELAAENMVSEGAMTTVWYENEKQADQ
ncbi:hypothetical protein MFLO_08792 [Listeria floridensis FSL S10-1187]|uniref:Uncharacterized protein n=1 Tax=Listeria floridensis FSL S10-1187 TaxID=1265817 RepID=A0ABN0REW2_9LIST|nr:hypothetical protein [Listeria floridensis]EUJ31514.1 hypothetical protein MFLO_08792 [Listeria floridensis FSL S10-1187]